MFRKIAVILCFALILWFWLPFFGAGILHIGMIYPTVLLLLLAAALLWWRHVQPVLARRRGWARLLCAVVALGLLILIIPLGCMTTAACRPADGDDVTVVVLGCQVRGETPSLMLAARCDAAYDYLTAHPGAVCVASGGQGAGESISEAQAIFNYLTAQGIDPARVYLEGTSTNTAENLQNTAAIIVQNDLPQTVAVATDPFHQYRAGWYARQAGLEPAAASCATALWLAPGYWAREIPAVWKAWLKV